MRPTDLDDPAPLEPSEELLAGVHARSASFPPRRSRQRIATALICLFVVALAGGFALARVDTGGGGVSGPPPPATSTTTPATTTSLPNGAVTVADLVGPWRPVTIAGFAGSVPRGPVSFAELRFDDAGSWSGSDGCNEITGSYHLGSEGALTFAVTGSTDVGCTEGFPPVPASLVAATRIELAGRRLSFLASNHHVIAQYAREDVVTRVELPSTTITAGSSIRATVVVANNSGRVLNATRCGGYFQLVLGNDHVHQAVLWRLCAENFAIPMGASTYPVLLSTEYPGCSRDTPTTDTPACLPGGNPPPLPPGEYRATLYQSGNAVPIPPPITVRVVAAR